MADIEIDKSNGAKTGTELFAQGFFEQDYVFQANATHAGDPNGSIDGLHGLGEGRGRGVVGKGGDSKAIVLTNVDSLPAARPSDGFAREWLDKRQSGNQCYSVPPCPAERGCRQFVLLLTTGDTCSGYVVLILSPRERDTNGNTGES